MPTDDEEEPKKTKYVPTERQLALFRAMEDIHDMTSAITVLLVDAHGSLVAVSGDENDVPPPLRAVLSGNRLKAAGSVRELLSSVDLGESSSNSHFCGSLNVTLFDVDGATRSGATEAISRGFGGAVPEGVGGAHVLAILFDADADLGTVQAVGSEARDMLAEILAAPL